MLQKHRFWTHWYIKTTLRQKCVYSEFFWSIFSCILSIFSPNTGKYGPWKLRIRTLLHRQNQESSLSNNHIQCEFRSSKVILKNIPHSQALTTKTICSAQTEYIKKLWNNGIKIHRDKIQREPLKIPNGWSREYQFCA